MGSTQAERLRALLSAKKEHDEALVTIEKCAAAGALTPEECAAQKAQAAAILNKSRAAAGLGATDGAEESAGGKGGGCDDEPEDTTQGGSGGPRRGRQPGQKIGKYAARTRIDDVGAGTLRAVCEDLGLPSHQVSEAEMTASINKASGATAKVPKTNLDSLSVSTLKLICEDRKLEVENESDKAALISWIQKGAPPASSTTSSKARARPKGSTKAGTESGEQAAEDKPRRVRAATSYNLFLKEELARLKGADPSLEHKQAFKQAAANWAAMREKRAAGSDGPGASQEGALMDKNCPVLKLLEEFETASDDEDESAADSVWSEVGLENEKGDRSEKYYAYLREEEGYMEDDADVLLQQRNDAARKAVHEARWERGFKQLRTGLEALVAKNSKGKEASSENAAALVIAMSRGIFDSKVVELLVQLGADVNFRVPPSKGEEEDEGTRREELYWYQGMTPLMMALDLEDSPHLECIRTLLRLGADRSAQAGQDADPWGGGSIEGMTSFEILRKNIKSRVEEYVANEGIDIVDGWYENEIQVYASHQVFRKFPHTAGIGNTALAEYERVRWETLELLLDPKDHEVLIDGVMTPVMRLKLLQQLQSFDCDDDIDSEIFCEQVYTYGYFPRALTQKLAKKKKESFVDGIRRLREATKHLLESNFEPRSPSKRTDGLFQLPTVDRLLDLLDKEDVEGVDWCWNTEVDHDDDGNIIREETRRCEKRHTDARTSKRNWDVYLECGGRVEYFLDYLLGFGEYNDDSSTDLVEQTNDWYFRDLDEGKDMKTNEEIYYPLDHATKVREELKTPHPLGSDWGFVRYKMLGPRCSFFDFRSRQKSGEKFRSPDDANAYAAYVKSRKSAAKPGDSEAAGSGAGDKKGKRKRDDSPPAAAAGGKKKIK